jgi:hypothetical protein
MLVWLSVAAALSHAAISGGPSSTALEAPMDVRPSSLANFPSRLSRAALDAAKNVSFSVSPSNGPRKLIILSHGRGGSTVVASTLGQFTLAEKLDDELFGEDDLAMATVSSPTHRIETWFKKQEKHQPGAHYVGFKWKPVYSSPAYDAAWQWVGTHAVRVVSVSRNFLDTLISMTKHQQATDLPAHCYSNRSDSECVQQYESVRVHLDVNTIVQSLADIEQIESQTMKKLDEFDVQYLHASFQNLFAGENTSRQFHNGAGKSVALAAWNSVLKFLGEPTATDYHEIAVAITATGLESTSRGTQCDLLKNAAEVRTALRGTRFDGLLEC